MGMSRWLAAMGLAVSACLGAYGQAGRAEFEVASIKASPPPDGRGVTVGCSGGPGTRDPGMLSCENMSLKELLTIAYNINYDQVAAPEWAAQEKVNVAARVPAGTTREQLPEMWQRLLADRFK